MRWTALPLLAMPVALAAQDTLTVRADGPPAWGDGVRLAEELRIGTLDGDVEYVLGRVSAVAPGPDGSVYVADYHVPAIRHYGSDGSWLGDVGREGQGPGEYLYPMGLAWPAGGHLTLYDYRNARVTRYDAEGEYLESFPTLSGLLSAEVFKADTAGNVYIKATATSVRDLPQGAEWPMAWIRHGPEGEVVDSIPIPPDDLQGPNFVLSGYGGYFRPFNIMNVSTMSTHGYLVWARNDRYAVHRSLPGGDVLRIERSAERIRLKPDEKDQWEARLESMARRPGSDLRGDIPDVKPVIRHLFVDDDGRIWVALYAEAHHRPHTPEELEERGDRPPFEWRQPLVWDVLDPCGALLGTVTLPHGTSLMAARGSEVWGIQGGDFDEAYVVRFGLRGAAVATPPPCPAHR